MTYEWIPSKWFAKGPRTNPIRKCVWHTIESPCEIGMARAAALYCQTRPDKVSAHYFVDPATVIQGVLESDIAYCAPGANSDGVHIEQAGRAAFTFADWMAHTAMFQITASLTADICRRNQIPPAFLTAADMVADLGAKGITTHAEVSKAYHLSDHTDPGVNFPIDYVIAEVRSLLAPQEDDDMMPCVIPANAQPLPNGRFPYYTFHNDGGGQWSLRGGNGAQFQIGGANVATTVLPLAVGAKPLGLAEHAGFIVAVADDDATYAYVMG